MYELNNFESIKIALASPEKIRQWSKGEVKKPETINYRTLKPEKEGLFCEKIFGPTKDWECHCGKYKRVRYKGVVCDRCGVEVTKSKVRRERMGHIELAAPVSHIWYFKGIPSRMGLLLDMSPRSLEKVLYFAAYIVIDPGETGLTEKQVLTEKEYSEAIEKYGSGSFKAGMGAESVKKLLENIDLEELYKDLRSKLKESTGQKRIRTIRRLEVVDAFKHSGNKPEWMILDVIPVIPPELRPMVQLDGGRFATSDLNDLYRRVINRNNRLKRLLDLGAPDIIVRNEKRMLQEAVDALIDNGRRGKPVTGPGNRPLKSLSDMLKGKQGRFRQNLLGKRVDYSGRSVIVVGPELKFYQCGLPKKMALELFKPFVMKKLVEDNHAHNIKSAKRMVEKVKPEVWDVLEEVIREHPVLLNRAPTLHRLGIQAFEPVLVEGKAIKLHPLVCTAYNADFDGDQMAVHVPLSVEAQAEARFLMLAPNNILAPKDGQPITTPTQDMILGSYYLTIEQEGVQGEGMIFKDHDEMLMAYANKAVHLHARVKVRRKLHPEDKGRLVESTVGRFIFNEEIPQNLGFVDRKKDPYALEVDFLCDKKALGKVIDKCFRKHGNTITAIMLDYIKKTGFRYSTQGAITIAVGDMEVPKEKGELISLAEEKVDKYEKAFRRGLISDEERYEKVIETWSETTEKVTEALMATLGSMNNMFIMAHSGARGSKNQIRQLGGMRGLMANATGKTVEIPIKANFREGLTVLEYFISTHGARKGLADTALRTADSGYLTRRLVDVSQDVIIREIDCGSQEGSNIKALKDGNEVIEELYDRIVGRYTLEEVIHPETGEVMIGKNEMILEDMAEEICALGIESVKIRSALKCQTRHGVCAHCYGRNLATGEAVKVGEAVGIIAAQSIGEPGTQLTMRTFHTGGVAGADITQGLPRVEELFEARKPKGLAIISELSGTVKVVETKKKREVIVTDEHGESNTYTIPYGSRMKVRDGEFVELGDEITDGSVNPHDILRIKDVAGVQNYIIKEVQRVYRLQGVDINDKHIEVIVRQMLNKVKIEEAGDTNLLPGSLETIFKYEEENARTIAAGGEPADGKPVLLGITKASLATESFLSAASFQETTRVLTEAAIKGKEDHLIGLKENVIIGKLIPAGTGLKRYKNIALNTEEVAQEEIEDTIEEIVEENL
ncbi:DNA-directed RNA polymerase subunit beta' [Alkaliphilus oremlandii]|uniref:DNA-directed RNA polymerase subunit beta' n=1 Tax=Alkaliphilus oremlandii (strain OhILAs) TaxID=350688 RepID=RPOC_ALKOO|nr:DNA-directed RNA polymerase subunit beta' [Alkaliphilus oremlandii]A8MLD3.1 RecName: Full=DNA-directed RNA polymerase subunit beta'; Short=RNAP subunit beta'; AltName: Full=RNA polymerase subunit beta'; AltName: Full=Transcriptase subunit beta' [Alkaliphilus oremlandii OhILAs]ABW18047.1 DNA-directed RNA polymerase, beta' subunit [Alkaliphilus oremlandii OhILAs]